MRDLTRQRIKLVRERASVVNRLQKVLEGANIKLASVVTDVLGVSARAMLEALLAGTDSPAEMADLSQARLRHKREVLEQALTGQVREHHRFVLGELLDHLGYLDGKIATLEERMQTLVTALPGFADAIERLDTIPGVNRRLAEVIIAEVGTDMRPFVSAKHLAAWAGVAPGNNESAGKNLRAQYDRLARRRGRKRALGAVARSIIVAVYAMLSRR